MNSNCSIMTIANDLLISYLGQIHDYNSKNWKLG